MNVLTRARSTEDILVHCRDAVLKTRRSSTEKSFVHFYFFRLSSTRLSRRSWVCSVASTRSKRACTALSSARIASSTRSRSAASSFFPGGETVARSAGSARASRVSFPFKFKKPPDASKSVAVFKKPELPRWSAPSPTPFAFDPKAFSTESARSREGNSETSRRTRNVASDADARAGFFRAPPPKTFAPATRAVSVSFSAVSDVKSVKSATSRTELSSRTSDRPHR